MAGINKKLEVLADDVAWFASATEIRAHFIYADSDISETVLRSIMRGFRITDRLTPYLTFVEPFAGEDAGWPERVRTLEDARTALAEELAARGTIVRAAVPAAYDFGGFGVRLLDFAAATAAVCAPPVVVLAPEHIEASERWAREIESLVLRPELASIRFVFVVPDEAHVRSLVPRLGESGLTTDCRSTPEEDLAALEALTRNAEAASPEAPPLALLGMAWPRVAPPPRRLPSGEAIRAHERTDAERARLVARSELMRAAAALTKRAVPESVRRLRAASDALRGADLVQESLTVRLMMATSVATAGERKLACRELDSVVDEANRCERHDVAAQAASAKASLLAAARETAAAIEAYGAAITAARAAGPDAVPLLIEVLRAAGQLCLSTGQEERGVACFLEALSVADAAPPRSSAGAADVARALADVCRKRGLRAQAEALEEQATGIERASLLPEAVEPAAEPA